MYVLQVENLVAEIVETRLGKQVIIFLPLLTTLKLMES